MAGLEMHNRHRPLIQFGTKKETGFRCALLRDSVNQLPYFPQAFTSLAIESKYMKRWEFDSIAQAAKGLMSWFHQISRINIPNTKYITSSGEAFHEAGAASPSTCCSSEDENS
ncbi:hypothetical protein CTI12_AA574520 [Artemisia annua]|uniref:Uncharacterized protein n=1 Tax=Artemisia annua TaxID=35608 RepID=A0A2U1KL53_ARTAN|nr:hypothetical protein CTI12_AA574520 [Artemisia annua]